MELVTSSSRPPQSPESASISWKCPESLRSYAIRWLTAPVSQAYRLPTDVCDSVSTTIQRNLEGVLIYAATQLAMWLLEPEFDADVSDMLPESQSADSSKERRARKQSVTLAERLRRGMTGEMAADLQSLPNKTKVVMAKSAAVGDGGVDLTQVLLYFLQECVSISP